MEIRRALNGLVCLVVGEARRQLQFVTVQKGVVDLFYDSRERISELYPEKVSAELPALATAAREYLKAENVAQSARAVLLTIIKEFAKMNDKTATAKKVGVKVAAAKSETKKAPAAAKKPAAKTEAKKPAPKATPASGVQKDKPPFTPTKNPVTKAPAAKAPAAKAAPATKKGPGRSVIDIDDSAVKGGFLKEFVAAAKKLKKPFTRDNLLDAIKAVKESDERKMRYFNYCIKHGIFIC